MGETEVFFSDMFYDKFERIAKSLERISSALESMPLPEIHEELKASNNNLIEIAKALSRD